MSEVYGQHLLLCRVMVGNTYQGNESKIPDGYNSKVGVFCNFVILLSVKLYALFC